MHDRGHTRKHASAALLCLLSISITPTAWPGALWITESGGADLAVASAGRAALAADATTLAANPAGMSGLPRTHLAIELVPARLDLEFDADDPATGTASTHHEDTLLGSAHLVQTAGRLSWGFGVHSYLGFGFEFERDWAGSRMIQDARLRSLNLAPAISWRATDAVDVGLAVNAQLAQAEVGLAVSNDASIYGPPAGLPDGRLQFDGDSWALGANLGVLYRPDAATRIGLAWTSGTDHRFELDARASGLHPVPAAMLAAVGAPRIEMDFPQQLLLSGVRQVTAATSISGSVAWQDWSSFGTARVEAGGFSAPLFPHGLDDTWHASVGVRRQLSPQWAIASGIAYDTDPSEGHPVPIYFPMTAQLRTALGLEYQPRPELVLRLSYSLLSQGAVRVDPEYHPLPLPGMVPVPGQFAPSRLHAVGIAVERRW